MARLLDTKVKYYDDLHYDAVGKEMREWGSFLPMLDDLLITGIGSFAINTLMFEEDDKYPDDYWLCWFTTTPAIYAAPELTVIEIKGSSLPYLNKEHRVQRVQDNKIYIAIPKTQVPEKPSNIESVSSTVVSYPALGWEKQWEREDTRVYRIKDSKYRNFYLRFQVKNDPRWRIPPSHPRIAHVSMYDQMDHIDDIGFKPERLKAPYASEDPTLPEDPKGQSYMYGTIMFSSPLSNSYLINQRTSAFSRSFYLIGDSKTFYFSCAAGRTSVEKDVQTTTVFGLYRKFEHSQISHPFVISGSIANQNVNSNTTVRGNSAAATRGDRNYDSLFYETQFPLGSGGTRESVGADSTSSSLHTFNEEENPYPKNNTVIRLSSAGRSRADITDAAYNSNWGKPPSITPCVPYVLRQRFGDNSATHMDGSMRLLHHIKEETHKPHENFVVNDGESYFACLMYTFAGNRMNNYQHVAYHLNDPED